MRSICFPLALAASALAAQQTSVLFIGNSYTYVNDLPDMFRELALSLGDTVTTGMAAIGGYQLGNHIDDPATLAAIASQPWDFVAMQEQSQLGALPLDITAFEVGAAALVQLIEANDECTYPVFYMTWGRKNGDAVNCPSFPFMCTYDGMQQALRDNYLTVAEENDARVSPVGWAWKHARDTHPGIELYQADESHPSVHGSYLAACVFYCALFKQSCMGASFISTVQPDTAAILQAIASATVLDSLDTWNLNVPNGTDATITGSSSGAWNEITFYHPGQGQHWWICSDGESYTDQQPTFILPGPGIYTFTHVYLDPCGNMDTYIWTSEVYANGVNELTGSAFAVGVIGPSMIQVMAGRSGTFSLYDTRGRLISTQKILPGTTSIPCSPGLALWTIHDATGVVQSGKVAVE